MVSPAKVPDKPSGDNSKKIGEEMLTSLTKQDVELLVTLLNNVQIKGDMAEQFVRMKAGLARVSALFPG